MGIQFEADVPPIGDNEPDELDTPDQTGERTCIVCGLPIPDSESGGRRRKKHTACAPATTSTGSKSTKGVTSIDTLINQIGSLYRNVGMGVTFVPGCQSDGMAVTIEAGTLAESWRPLIEKDPKIRKAWERITTGSGWGTVLIVHAGLAMTIASNHGVSLPGMPQPQPQQGGTPSGAE